MNVVTSITSVNTWVEGLSGYDCDTAVKLTLIWENGDGATTAPIVRRVHLFYEIINK
jgi:hypothetical protein